MTLAGHAGAVPLLARQFLAMVENQRLYVALGAARDQLQHRALHDDLTGRANRALFNDRLGHAAGDEVQVEVARRQRGFVRAGDTVVRLGGDEFAILLDDSGETEQVADRVITAMLEPFAAGGTTIGMSAQRGPVDPVDVLPGERRLAGLGRGPPAARGGPRAVRREDVGQGPCRHRGEPARCRPCGRRIRLSGGCADTPAG